jgi:hypothetical protein
VSDRLTEAILDDVAFGVGDCGVGDCGSGGLGDWFTNVDVRFWEKNTRAIKLSCPCKPLLRSGDDENVLCIESAGLRALSTDIPVTCLENVAMAR